MTAKIRLWFAGMTLVAAMGIVSLTSASFALGDKDSRPAVIKIGESFKKGDAAGAKTAAAKVAKDFEEVADLMHLFRARSAGGLGWGMKASGVPKDKADALEKKLNELEKAKGGPADFAKNAAATEEAAYALAAMAELTHAKTPAKDAAGGKTKKAWMEWSEQMRDASLELAKAAAGKDGAAASKAAAKVNAACNSCHSKFKE
jgi:hypothetical protein